MVIFGKRTVRIKQYQATFIKCQECGHYGQVFSVYQEYFHFFFIPFVPSNHKTIRCICPQCKDRFNEEKKKHYLSITRTPFYLYAGLIFIAASIIILVIDNINTQKEKAAFIEMPEKGDVYLIQHKEDNETSYYFLKVVGIHSDTLKLLYSALQYNQYVWKMDHSDYFVKGDTLKFLKADLKTYLEDGTINSVNRVYEQDSRFRTEK